MARNTAGAYDAAFEFAQAPRAVPATRKYRAEAQAEPAGYVATGTTGERWRAVAAVTPAAVGCVPAQLPLAAPDCSVLTCFPACTARPVLCVVLFAACVCLHVIVLNS
jgi:hypothetical protein